MTNEVLYNVLVDGHYPAGKFLSLADAISLADELEARGVQNPTIVEAR